MITFENFSLIRSHRLLSVKIDNDRCFFKVKFNEKHKELYEDAKKNSSYLSVISHYYSVMSVIIDEYFNGNFHFVPPQVKGQTLDEALLALHKRIANLLDLKKGYIHCIVSNLFFL